jgi:hypothetical protein
VPDHALSPGRGPAVKPFVDAGFTDIALVQIGGGHQDPFVGAAKERILPALQA